MEFDINEVQNQIFLSGILGDGNFKKNGSNYYYRECHAVTEEEYLKWKFDRLKNLTTGKIYNTPARKETQNAQVGLQTQNSPSFNKYANMSKMDALNGLDELGVIL